MRTLFLFACVLAVGIAFTFGWAGLICLNSGEPDFTEQFWSFGFLAFIAAFALLCCHCVWPRSEEA